MYYLNKLVWLLLNPAAAGLVLLLAGLFFVRRRFGRALLVLACVWFVFWMSPLTSVLLGYPLERDYLVDGCVPSVESYTNADAIVVLGGGMGVHRDPDGAYHAEMNANSDRVWMGARLFAAEKAPKIVLTSSMVDKTTLPLLKDLGVDEECVEFHEEPRNTEEEARLLASDGVKRVLLVTSAWHMRRAEMMFRRYAPELEIVPAPADWEYTLIKRRADESEGFERLLALVPDTEAFWRNAIAFKEWVGYVGYRFFR